jgi:hypothetical protein
MAANDVSGGLRNDVEDGIGNIWRRRFRERCNAADVDFTKKEGVRMKAAAAFIRGPFEFGKAFSSDAAISSLRADPFFRKQ